MFIMVYPDKSISEISIRDNSGFEDERFVVKNGMIPVSVTSFPGGGHSPTTGYFKYQDGLGWRYIPFQLSK